MDDDPGEVGKKSPVDPLAIRAAGQACLGLGHAIRGLAAGGNVADAAKLSQQLLYLVRSISWLCREDRDNYPALNRGKVGDKQTVGGKP